MASFKEKTPVQKRMLANKARNSCMIFSAEELFDIMFARAGCVLGDEGLTVGLGSIL